MYFGIIPVNKILIIFEKKKETMIKCFHKAVDSKFDDAYTRDASLLFLILIHRCISIQYQPRCSYLILKDNLSISFFLFLGEK